MNNKGLSIFGLCLSCSILSVAFSIFFMPSLGVCSRYALVIGNSNYKDSRLKNPVNDAILMKKTLVDVGFKVTMVEDGDKGEMEKSVATFSSKLTSRDEALFFYAGHAVQIKNENYLLPLGVSGEEEIDISSSLVKLTDIINNMKRSRISIVVLDACRVNPYGNYYLQKNGVLTRSSRSIGVRLKNGLAPEKRAMGTLIAYSTDIGNVAYDGSGKNSIFTENLVKYIKVPGLPLENVFKRVRTSVSVLTNNKQIPWDSSSLIGDFYFVQPKDKIIFKPEKKLFTPVF